MTLRIRGQLVLLRAFHESEYPRLWESELAAGVDARDDEQREKFYERLRLSGGWTPQELRLAVEVEGEVIGDIQARRWGASLPPGVTELGVQLFADARGRGFGTDALRTLDRHLFEEDGFHRVQLSTDVDNAAMRRVADKAGFREEGTLRGYWSEDGAIHDYVMYGRTLADHVADGGRGPTPGGG
jgi:RimJ/RimL family protein N-acetyltransferase